MGAGQFRQILLVHRKIGKAANAVVGQQGKEKDGARCSNRIRQRVRQYKTSEPRMARLRIRLTRRFIGNCLSFDGLDCEKDRRSDALQRLIGLLSLFVLQARLPETLLAPAQHPETHRCCSCGQQSSPGHVDKAHHQRPVLQR